MASNPPQACCTQGVKHEGKATGEIKTLFDTECYISTPSTSNPQKAILFITDVIGHSFVNAQLLADYFASFNYLILVPDIFHGDAIPLNRPEGFVLQDWLQGKGKYEGTGGHGIDRVEPIIKNAIKWLREEKGIKKVGGVGYCFGAKYVIRSLDDQGGLDVGYVAHPSFVEERELEGIKRPLSIAAAETDNIFPPEKRHRSEEILKATKVPYQITLYSGVEHGFSIRGNVSKKHIKFAKEAAAKQAVDWFDYWFTD